MFMNKKIFRGSNCFGAESVRNGTRAVMWVVLSDCDCSSLLKIIIYFPNIKGS